MSDLYKNLVEYSKSDYYPLHMPGHKRNVEMIEGENPYSYDITEIEGFDNLHNPQGILRIAKEEAAGFYESDKTYFLINGSSCGILSAICGLTKRGDKILVARNCHKSVYNAIYLNELTPVYIVPEYIEKYGINGGISPEKVADLLSINRDIKAVVITSPTYEGVVSDVKAIADIAHGAGIPLIVDEAHGAHFGMHRNLPKSALMEGADVVIQSLHKTLPSLTQTALLHVKSQIVDVREIERYLAIYQTSSPSYVLISSIDECINRIKSDGMLLFEPYMKRMEILGNYISKLTELKIVGRDIIGENAVYDFDISKVVISVRGSSYSGKKVYDEMLEKFHLQLEMASRDYAIAMTSVMDTEEGILRLFTAMTEIDRDMRIYGKDKMPIKIVDYAMSKPTVAESIYKAVQSEKEEVSLGYEAVGKISAEYVYLYPPGVPVLAPGEVITTEIIKLLESYEYCGLEICGNEKSGRIKVIKEDFKRISLTKGIYHIR